MRTQYYTATSLDGFIATPDDSLEWLFPLGDINATGYPEFIDGVGALAMGSSTYEWMLRHVVQPGTGGKPLLPRKIVAPSLKLLSVRQFGPGFAELRYELPRPAQPLARTGA